MKKYLTFYFLLLFQIIQINSIYCQGWYIEYQFSLSQTINAIRFYDQNTGWMTSSLYNGSTYNIYKTTNAGLNWTAQNSGFTSMRFMSIWIVDLNTIYMSGNSGRIVKTTNGGQNWDSLITNSTEQLWGIQFVNATTGFTAGSNGQILKTTNAGLTWNPQTSGVPNAFSSVYFLNENTGFVSGSAVVVKTTNGGASWFNLNAPFINGFENFREIYFQNDLTGFYGSDMGRILKTTNSGVNWYLVNSNTTQSIFGLAFPVSGTGYACGYNGIILKTTDNGENWINQTSNLTEILTDIVFTSLNTGYITTWYGKVLKTTNGGTTFINQNSNLHPAKFYLYQNYPNPFNPGTRIKFDLKDEKNLMTEEVKLVVYDIQGKEIAILINDRLQPGSYEVNFDSRMTSGRESKLNSGIYFYKLLVGNYSKIRKMILLK